MLLAELSCFSEGPGLALPFVDDASGSKVPQFNPLPVTRVNVLMENNVSLSMDRLRIHF
jgi:hypothetical protein